MTAKIIRFFSPPAVPAGGLFGKSEADPDFGVSIADAQTELGKKCVRVV
jgi:hypothetical protein